MRIAGVLALVWVTGACVPFTDNEQEAQVSLADRPSMEQILREYEAFRADALAELDRRFGTRDWAVDDGASGFSTAACIEEHDGGDQAETALPPTLSFEGSWDRADWEAVRQTVAELGRERGFTEVTSITDRAEDLEIVAEDAYGGRYVFGTAVNTIFSLSTGCHIWDGEPAYPPAPGG